MFLYSNPSEHLLQMSVLLNYLTIVGVAACNTTIRPYLTDSRKVLLAMDSYDNMVLKDLNTQRIDNAYTEIHRSLRRQMFEQAGGAAHGNLQRLTMADYTLSFTCTHDTTPIVHDALICRNRALMKVLEHQGVLTHCSN